ncbi:MAG: hypothetical protein QOE05_2752 [Actinomycetota bacterium]|jgi:hypothetical protein|nr:hypothetical protein [Actinomycetota bacterium]
MTDNDTVRRLIELAERMTRATDSGSVKWSPNDDTGTSFSYSTREASISIRSKDGDGVHPFILEVFDSGGVMVESLASGYTEIPDDPWASTGFVWNAALEGLYGAARRNALNIDSVIDSLLRSIEPPF